MTTSLVRCSVDGIEFLISGTDDSGIDLDDLPGEPVGPRRKAPEIGREELGALAGVVNTLTESLGDTIRSGIGMLGAAEAQVEIKMGVAVKTGLWVVQGSGESAITLKFVWKNSEPAS